MKLLIPVLIVCLAGFTSASPTSISDNNIGNIVTVGVNAGIDIKSNVDFDLITVLALNMSLINSLVTPNQPAPISLPKELPKQITPEMIEKFKKFIAKK